MIVRNFRIVELAIVTLVLVGFTSVVTAASYPAAERSAAELRSRLDAYIQGIRNLRCQLQIVRLARTSSGRISEKKYNVDCVTQNYVTKISQFSQGVIEGEKTWFDVRETLVFPSGDTAEWRHPGFPGQLSFGKTSPDSQRIRYSAFENGDPLYPLKKIARVLKRDTLKVVEITPQTIIGRMPVGKEAPVTWEGTDYIEIVFSREFGDMPISMTRICANDNPDRKYDSDCRVEIEYAKENDFVVPTVARLDTKLKDDVQGDLTTTWTYAAFDPFAEPTPEEVKLTLPIQVLVENVDTRRQFTVTSSDDDGAKSLRERFGDTIEIQPRVAAMITVAKSFVGQCPNLPSEYQYLREQSSASKERSGPSRWGIGLLAAHGAGLWAIAGFLRRRRKSEMGTPIRNLAK